MCGFVWKMLQYFFVRIWSEQFLFSHYTVARWLVFDICGAYSWFFSIISLHIPSLWVMCIPTALTIIHIIVVCCRLSKLIYLWRWCSCTDPSECVWHLFINFSSNFFVLKVTLKKIYLSLKIRIIMIRMNKKIYLS